MIDVDLPVFSITINDLIEQALKSLVGLATRADFCL